MEDAKRRSVREAALMARLKRHRDNDNIVRLEERRAKYGLNVPLELENELTDEQAMAAEVEAQLQHLMAGGEDRWTACFMKRRERVLGDRLAGPCNSTNRSSEKIRRILT